MAQSENHCSDNYTLATGPIGQTGIQGPTGAVGKKGPKGAKGAKGAAGKNKIDISFQGENLGYKSITDTSYTPIGYFIYNGTGVFTPTTLTVGASVLSVTGTTTVDLELKSLLGSTSAVFATITKSESNTSTHKISLPSTSTFSNLPSTATVIQVSAKISQYTLGKFDARIYSLELR